MNSSQTAALKFLMRLEIRYLLSRMDAKSRSRKSKKIESRLIRSRFFQKTGRIFAYMATREEVQTRNLLQKALKFQKQIFLPAVVSKNRMQFYAVKNLNSDLKLGVHDILEPKQKRRVFKPQKGDLLLVPGLGFDSSKNRLGRGAGFYDRYLSKTNALKIGLAFREQKVSGEIPSEAHDQKIDILITD